jgi:aspartate aminotransferase-like enzyme
MNDKLMLMIPGPTPVPERVLQAMAKHPIGHRSADFSAIFGEVTANLKWLHQTDNDLLILAASGTGAMEAAIINFLSAGDTVLVGTNGKFGERWGELCEAYHLNVQYIKADWGQPLDPNAFKQALDADSAKAIKAVIITHSETSTGVINDLQTIAAYIKSHGALSMIDTVTSLGACSVPIDDWGLDVVASGSQKGYMIPPGLGFVAVSEKAWKAYETATLPKFYFDLGPYRKNSAKDTTPFTPAINLIFALHAALAMMKEEGLEPLFARHDRLKNATRAAMKAMGLPLYGADDCASPAITAVMPTTVDAEQVRSVMKKQFDIILAGGQDTLKGKIFRIGHLGFVSDRDLLTAVAALEATLQSLGHPGTAGAGVAAASKVLLG